MFVTESWGNSIGSLGFVPLVSPGDSPEANLVDVRAALFENPRNSFWDEQRHCRLSGHSPVDIQNN
jgi:hypothetical protein